MGEAIPWEQLRAEAALIASSAYAPYSSLAVGACGLVEDGRIARGCNVENASYGLTLCAECGLVSDLVSAGGGRLVAVSVVDGDGALLMPCGRCRQLLHEHGGVSLLIDRPEGPIALGELLPDAFGPDDLPTT